jgi:hypothetical protein
MGRGTVFWNHIHENPYFFVKIAYLKPLHVLPMRPGVEKLHWGARKWSWTIEDKYMLRLRLHERQSACMNFSTKYYGGSKKQFHGFSFRKWLREGLSSTPKDFRCKGKQVCNPQTESCEQAGQGLAVAVAKGRGTVFWNHRDVWFQKTVPRILEIPSNEPISRPVDVMHML